MPNYLKLRKFSLGVGMVKELEEFVEKIKQKFVGN